jgi:small subunit ribosomal protein S16
VAVKIRLKRMGKVRAPYYRIVVCDSRTKRDGRVIEEIGTYNPKAEPSVIHVDSERALHWLGVGAQPSTPVAAILKLTGDWQRFKGEEVTPTLKTAEPARDKTEIFNEALKDAHAEPKAEAVTKKAARPEKQTEKQTEKQPEKQTEKQPAKPAEEPAAAEESAAPEGVERADKAHAEAASGEGSEAAASGEVGEAGATGPGDEA